MINKMFLSIIPVSYVRTTQKQKYVDKTYHKYYAYKEHIQTLVKGKLKKLEGPISLVVTFYMPIPKNGKSCGVKVKEGQFHISTKDLDNLVKGLLDALNGIAFIDDKQVCQINSEKVYSHNPGIGFELWELEEEQN
ncbi:RusA family crossover junction endodeoxyribonuclease [Neobacillus sp. M.A.Huq-85]